MALQIILDRTDETGDTYPTAYWRIDALEWFRATGELIVRIGVYRTATAAATKQPVVTRSFAVTGPAVATILTAGDLRAAIYAYLKTLPAFSGATDV
jgi:hypothetical protein